MKQQFYFSKHYRKDKSIHVSLAIDCIQTGKRKSNKVPNKFKSWKKYNKGELFVIWIQQDENIFVITAIGIDGDDVCETQSKMPSVRER
jgi:hypothetical protein